MNSERSPNNIQYSTQAVWDLLDEVHDHYIPWKQWTSGSPTYSSIFDNLVKNYRLQEEAPELCSRLQSQIIYNLRYQYEHYEELR